MRTESVGAPAAPAAAAKNGQQVEQLQGLLNEYFPAAGLEESGRWTPETEHLVRDFQRQRGLEVTGRADAATVDELRRAASWIAHERAGSADGDEPTAQHPPTRPPSSGTTPPSTEAALLQRALDTHMAESQTGRHVSFEPRALNAAERLVLEAFLRQPHIQGYLDFARDHGKTVVLGVGGDAGAGARGCVSSGIYFGPSGEVGLTGSVGVAGIALQIGAAATAQVTVLDGEPERLRGTSLVMGVSGGVGLVGGASAIIDPSTDERIGFTLEVGVGIGLTPLEGYIQVTDGVTTDSVTEPHREAR